MTNRKGNGTRRKQSVDNTDTIERIADDSENTMPSPTVMSSHLDSPKTLRVRFEIPKDKYKGSNTRDVDVVSRRKSAWLRKYGEQVWRDALEREFGVVALEPDESDWKHSDDSLTPSEVKAKSALGKQSIITDEVNANVEQTIASIESYKAEMHAHKRNESAYVEAKQAVDSLNSDLKELRRRQKIENKVLTRLKHAWDKAHSRQNGRRASADRKSYLKAKAKLNEDRLVFKGTVKVSVQSNIVTTHDFDAPNCWPSIKPLQDGGTDTCVLWRDDNNAIIKETSFYGGGKASNDCYVLEMIVQELSDTPKSDHPDDPFIGGCSN